MQNMFEETNVDNQTPQFAEAPKAEFKLDEGETVYDDCFVVRKSRFGLFTSIKLDGTKMVTGLTLESCLHSTRFDLKAEVDGTLWTGDNVKIMGSAIVGGKL
jgi:hypothetical protein